MSDKDIVERTVDDLSWLGLINKKDVGFAKVHRTHMPMLSMTSTTMLILAL